MFKFKALFYHIFFILFSFFVSIMSKVNSNSKEKAKYFLVETYDDNDEGKIKVEQRSHFLLSVLGVEEFMLNPNGYKGSDYNNKWSCSVM